MNTLQHSHFDSRNGNFPLAHPSYALCSGLDFSSGLPHPDFHDGDLAQSNNPYFNDLGQIYSTRSADSGNPNSRLATQTQNVFQWSSQTNDLPMVQDGINRAVNSSFHDQAQNRRDVLPNGQNAPVVNGSSRLDPQMAFLPQPFYSNPIGPFYAPITAQNLFPPSLEQSSTDLLAPSTFVPSTFCPDPFLNQHAPRSVQSSGQIPGSFPASSAINGSHDFLGSGPHQPVPMAEVAPFQNFPANGSMESHVFLPAIAPGSYDVSEHTQAARSYDYFGTSFDYPSLQQYEGYIPYQDSRTPTAQVLPPGDSDHFHTLPQSYELKSYGFNVLDMFSDTSKFKSIGFFDASSAPYDSQGVISGSEESCTVSSAPPSPQDHFASICGTKTPTSLESAHQNGPVGHIQDFGDASIHSNTSFSEFGFEILDVPTPRNPSVAHFEGLPSFVPVPVSANEDSPSSTEYMRPTDYGESEFLPQGSAIDTGDVLPFATTPKPEGWLGAIEYLPQEPQVGMYDWFPFAPTPEPGGVVYNLETEGKPLVDSNDPLFTSIFLHRRDKTVLSPG
ncbi:hypothetical protein DFH11DRAFT_1546722 [Phellopilus nigrolimitatus]|nr:hypothetical protein DFH11DRAFT_1546722 [Phellopilus nigrolimitatus]